MYKMKKLMAVALAATMVMGSSLVAFADDPTNSGSISGSGTNEGHVKKEVLNMILPTVQSGSNPFGYTMDPERLVQETDAKKYGEDFIFPEKDKDTGVYFLVGDKEYANESNALQAINKSSCAVTLTVKPKLTASAGGKDIDIATAKPSGKATKAELYLALKIGNDEEILSATEKTLTKTIAGVEENFEVDYKNNVYVYQEKETKAKPWKAMNISLTGVVSNYDVEADTTAPTVDVTWSFAKAADGAQEATDVVEYSETPAQSSVPATVTLPSSGAVEVPVTIGTNGDELTKLETSEFSGDMLATGGGYGAVYADGKITIGADMATFLMSADESALSGVSFTATFGEGEDAYTQTFKFVK